MLVRTWNVFHGNAVPPRPEAYLAEAIHLVTADEPDVVCLQEVPVWALAHLGDWSGMNVFGAVAARPRFGPLPWRAELGRRLTELDHGLLRSAFTGQANAVLVAPWLAAAALHVLELNSKEFRQAQARALGLDRLTRLAWSKERRVCQAVRVVDRERVVVVANLHATGLPDDRIPDAEVFRAATFADGLARPGEVCVLAGDFNVWPDRSRTLADVTGEEWGFSRPSPRLDQVLVRSADAAAPVVWPEERRRSGARVVSDHAPVEVEFA